jgi:hypothetical protein
VAHVALQRQNSPDSIIYPIYHPKPYFGVYTHTQGGFFSYRGGKYYGVRYT